MLSVLIFRLRTRRSDSLAEFIESVMYLYQATKDPHFLEIGVDVLTSLEHSARTECGYATVSVYSQVQIRFSDRNGVLIGRSSAKSKREHSHFQVKNTLTHLLENRMESFFLAETTKYLYLLFDVDNFVHNLFVNHDRRNVTTRDGYTRQCFFDAGESP